MPLNQFNRYSYQELLKIRLSDLPCSIKNIPFLPQISILYQNLRDQGLKFKPHIWIADEWFSPDGVSGFAIPYYLMHPRFIELERLMMGKAEGSTPHSFLKLARHETGHAIENAYYLRRNKKRQRTFGLSSTEYPTSYIPKLYSKRFVSHLGEGYAQAHPDEDFAETFAVWLNPESKWQKKYEGTSAFEKLLIMHELMLNLKNQTPVNLNNDTPFCITEDERTLKEYYEMKKIQMGIKRKKLFTPTLKADSQIGGKKDMYHMLKPLQNSICKEISYRTNIHQYRIKALYKVMLTELANENLKTNSRKSHLVPSIKDLLLQKGPLYLSQGHDRIYM